MAAAKIFQSGNSQAPRLPKEFRFNSDRVEIFRRGDEIVLRETPNKAAAVFDVLTTFSKDFSQLVERTCRRENASHSDRVRLNAIQSVEPSAK